MDKKTIIVTGALGFIGAHLCNRLVKQGHHVIGIDNEMCPSHTELSDKVELHLADVCNMSEIWSKISQPIDEIYHLASIASPPIYKQHPLETIKTNVEGTIEICRFAKWKNAKLLLSSSSEIYGQPEVFPQSEEYFGHRNTLGERSPYDISKAMGETIVDTYRRKYNLNAVICRIHNTFGKGMNLNDGRLVVEIIKRAINNGKITIFNDGEQTRCLTYIDDTTNGLIKAMENQYYGPFNIGTTNEMTVNEIVNLILDITGSQSTVKHIEHDIDDPRRRIPDISKAKKYLGWEPKHNLRESMIAIIKNVVELMSNGQETIIQLNGHNPRVSIIDTKHYNKISKYAWYANKGRRNTFYAQCSKKHNINGQKVTLRMHRFLLNITNSAIFVDHINHNGLDNRISNLRKCSCAENNINKQKATNGGTSIYKGVHYVKNHNFPWVVQVSEYNNRKYLKHYMTKERAALAYDDYHKINNPKFANFNFPNITTEERSAILENEKILSEQHRRKQQSKYIGVSKRRERWQAICRNGSKRHFIGSFTTEIEAAKAYDKYVIDNNLNRKINFEN